LQSRQRVAQLREPTLQAATGGRNRSACVGATPGSGLPVGTDRQTPR
jgi:hypothetical protein